MSAILRTLLRGILDYAGLFPPARLAPAAAVSSFLSYRRGPAAWLLGRLVWPADRLPELLAHWPAGEAARLALVAGEGGPPEPRKPASELPAELVPELIERPWRGEESLTDAPALRRRGVRLFLEVPAEEVRPELLARFAQAGAGLKLRFGGAVPPPSPGLAARILTWTCAARVPLKATAGLHHALPADGRHGFLNLAVAAVLASAHRLPAAEVEALLAERDPGAFGFAGGRLRWRRYLAAEGDILSARREVFLGFGSCSFEEPRDELRRLGYL